MSEYVFFIDEICYYSYFFVGGICFIHFKYGMDQPFISSWKKFLSHFPGKFTESGQKPDGQTKHSQKISCVNDFEWRWRCDGFLWRIMGSKKNTSLRWSFLMTEVLSIRDWNSRSSPKNGRNWKIETHKRNISYFRWYDNALGNCASTHQ